MKLSLEEQETIIRWDKKYSSTLVYTFEPSLKRKLKELEHQFPDMVQLIAEDNGSVEYSIPKNLISIRKPRIISEDTRIMLKNNITKARQSKRPEADIGTQLQAF